MPTKTIKVKATPTYTKGQNTKANIINQATKLFSERGYSGTALSDVMSACDLTKGGFYAHFASKEALYIESIKTLLDREQKKYQRAADTAPPEARLMAFLNWMGESMAGDKPLGRQFLWMLLEPNPNVARHVIDKMFHPAHNELTSLLALRYSTTQAEVIAHSLLAVALLYEQIKARIMQPLIKHKSSALKFDTPAILDFLLERDHDLKKNAVRPAPRPTATRTKESKAVA